MIGKQRPKLQSWSWELLRCSSLGRSKKSMKHITQTGLTKDQYLIRNTIINRNSIYYFLTIRDLCVKASCEYVPRAKTETCGYFCICDQRVQTEQKQLTFRYCCIRDQLVQTEQKQQHSVTAVYAISEFKRALSCIKGLDCLTQTEIC
jgi:hypothetical protein